MTQEYPDPSRANAPGGAELSDPFAEDVVTVSSTSPQAGSPGALWTGERPADSSTSSVVKDEGKQVGQDAVESGKQVASAAAEQAKSVASEAGQQAQNLLGEATSQVKSQVATQQQNLAAWLRSLSEELKSMTESSQSSGVATSLARQASERVAGISSWLEQHEPTDALEEVSRFARQRPGTFLAVAALGGLLAGRLTRGLKSASTSDEEQRPAVSSMEDEPVTSLGVSDPLYAGTETVLPGGSYPGYPSPGTTQAGPTFTGTAPTSTASAGDVYSGAPDVGATYGEPVEEWVEPGSVEGQR